MQTLSTYHIIEQLYDSTNSLVYRGRRQSDAQPVILKVLKDAYPSPERIAWFKREYEITRSVDLSGVVRIYSLETDHHHWVMVQEDFGGESLRRLGLAGKLSIPDFLRLAIRITEILGHVHHHNIMHKDINPSNIVLNPQTQQIKFIDFGIATILSRENPTFRSPGSMEGTLAYMSPEQAGRMNRTMDYRTDFYSLGVTFYELLCGCLPFLSDDALELLHSHIARQPIPPHEHNPDIPPTLSAIILKLMAKNAEDRYQSAYGLQADLTHALQEWEETGTINPFPLGQYDVSDRFHIPQKLYGREQEIRILLDTFERASDGGSELLMVSGPAGIGKSALVQEIYKPVTRQRGYFIAGKFDQFQRNIPYSAFLQAFRSMMRLLLAEPEPEILAWRRKILDAVGKQGKVIIEVIPEVEFILGPQPEVAVLGPAESQNRLNMLFQNFIRVFTRPEHPLVLFLDDLQWADGASLKLMEHLMTSADTHFLCLIGAYRERHVDASHPLTLTLDAIKAANITTHHISLLPLDIIGTTQLITDTMRCSHTKAIPLAELVLAKTGGNPFFLNEFLKSLYVEGLINFVHPTIGSNGDHASPGHWTWNLEQIQQRDITDNVVELMATRVQQLAPSTQTVLQLAACIGNQFNLETLSVVYEQSPRTTAVDLWEAIAEGLIVPMSDAYKVADIDVDGLNDAFETEYKFTHDRIQQAVYSLIPRDDRQSIHWRIGRLLLEQYQTTPTTDLRELEDRIGEHIFDIVNQLNQGHTHIQTQEEQDELVSLNLIAGQRAIESAAYQPALTYLHMGVILLDDSAWTRCYDLCFTLYKEYAKCEYLNNHFAEAEHAFTLVLAHARTNLDSAEVYNIKMILSTSLGKLHEVIEDGIQGLSLLDMTISLCPSHDEIEQEIEQVRMLLGDRPIAELIHLPTATDPHHLARMRLLGDILISAWWVTNKNLYFLVSARMVHLSLRYGHTDLSAFGYAWYGVILGSGLGDYKSGYEFGQLALTLNEQFHNVQLVAKVNLVFGVFIQIWRMHVRESLPFTRRGYQAGIEVGDLLWAGINGYVVIYTMIIKGDELDEVFHEIQRYLDFSRKTKQVVPTNMLILSQQWVLSLKGLTRIPGSFTDHHYHEEHHIREIRESGAIRPIFWYYKVKLQVLYLFGHYTEALAIARDLDDLIEGGAAFGNITMPEHYFYYSLTLAALYPHATPHEQDAYWRIMSRNQEWMKNWTYHCPENFRHKYLLIAAEMAHLKGQIRTAESFYRQAIASAYKNGYVQNEALADELAARFYLEQGNKELAREHILEARNGYLKWGATAKVKALDKQYAHILPVEHPPPIHIDDPAHLKITTSSLGLTTPSTHASVHLDLAAVLKASQAISGEIVLETLLGKLLRIVIENAGAERGLLLLERDGNWVIEAEGHIDQEVVAVLQSQPINPRPSTAYREKPLLPLSIINYVAHTGESVVLHDATHTGQFTRDRYVTKHQPRSVLCTPLLNQGALVGMVYLENNLTTDAFTPDRIEVLNLLACQAAISIKNAVLYHTLKESEKKYRTLFHDSKDTIFITTLDGQIIDINPAGESLFGYSAEEFRQLNSKVLYTNPDDLDRFHATIRETGSVRDFAVTLKHRDGTPIECVMTASLRLGDDGAIVGYQGIVHDITAIKRAEEERAALLDQQARRAGELHAIIQSMADGLLVVDVSEHIIVVNPVAAKLLGHQMYDLIDQPLDMLTQVEDPVLATGLQHIVEQIRKELLDPHHILPEERITLGNRIVRLQSAPTLGSGDVLTGAVMVIQDITQAVEADRAKSAFIATASHEMRTPLASMKGFVDVFYLTGIDNLTTSQQAYLNTIRRQTDNLVHLVNDLLEVARLEQGTIRMERGWVSLETTFDEALAPLRDLIRNRDIVLVRDIMPGLPRIWIDALHLRRILTNILSNAIKYVFHGGRIHVRAYELHDVTQLPSPPGDQVWSSPDERSVVVEVEDNGVGIRAQDQERIFTRFFRSENPLSIEAGGSGLGLAITQSLVHLHHGQIGFRSCEQHGSCFWVRLPAPVAEPLHLR